ncbi:histone deacetylase family protein [Ceratobasidium sp. AG-Ba]|nr:histone deacetylase family protein [Ceratobasidium sp. AG-Ba]
MASVPRVAYILSQELAQVSSLLPSNRGRSGLVHTLANSYGLFKPENGRCVVVRPRKVERKELERYHEKGYLDHILQPHEGDEAKAERVQEIASMFGLEDDCPVFPGINDYVLLVAGATLTAAQAVQTGRFDAAICWDGGRHHAHKGHAAGFCYVADCVLSVHVPACRRGRDRTVEPSAAPSTVLTLSIHHHTPGFYPHSALGSLTRSYTSDPFALSIPLARGTSAASFARIWPIVEGVATAFFGWSDVSTEMETDEDQGVHSGSRPTYVVVQCGVDGLAGDPHAIWNWNIDAKTDGSIGWCVKRVMHWVRERTGLKAVFLGGGGYNSPNAARAWAYLTSIITGEPFSIDADIPDHAAFLQYAPSFILDVPAGNMRDENTEEEFGQIESTFKVLIERITHAQSQQK